MPRTVHDHPLRVVKMETRSMKKSWWSLAFLVPAGVLVTLACASPASSNASADAFARQDPKPKTDEKPKAEEAKPAPSVEKGDKAELGKLAPDFKLKDINGKEVMLSSFKGKTVVLEWFSPGCPMCVWAYSKGPLKEMPEQYVKDGAVWLAINSEAAANKSAKPEVNQAFVDKYSMKAPILLDPTGVVGKAYGAKSTPHMYVIDAKGVLQYRGALDNAPAGQGPEGDAPKVNYVDAAVKDLKAGKPVATPDTKSYG
jgi:peroxiredoxin